MKAQLQIFYTAASLTMGWNAIQWGLLSLGYEPLVERPQEWLAAVIFALFAISIGHRALELAKGEGDD